MTKQIKSKEALPLSPHVKYLELDFVLKAAQLGYWKLNLNTRTAERSLLHDQIFGYSHLLPEWTYELFLNHVHPEDQLKVQSTFNASVTNRTHSEFQCRIYRADDKRLRWISVSAEFAELNQEGYLLGLVQDITNQKNIELELQQKTSLYNTLLESMPDCLFISDQEGRIIFINQMAIAVFGYSKEEFLNKTIECLMPTSFQKRHVMHRQGYLDNPNPRPMGSGLTLCAKAKNGREFPVEISLSPVKTADGLLIIAILKDITARKRMETELAESEMRWKYALESANQGVWDWRVPEKIIHYSSAWKRMLGYDDDEIKDLPEEFESRVHPEDRKKMMKCLQDHFKQKTKEYNSEVRFRCKDGSYKWILDRGKVISRAPDGSVLRAIGTHTDISDLKRKEEQLKQLAEHDTVTGLINRSLFEDRMRQALAMAKRKKSHFAVCFLDVDNFKTINDSYGHAVGDLLLTAGAKCMEENIRSIDTVSRLGGDEFALILLDIEKEQDIINLLKKITDHFSKGFLINKKRLTVTLSIGIALYPQDGGTKNLVEKADSAMYYVKKHGKNNIKFFHTLPHGE